MGIYLSYPWVSVCIHPVQLLNVSKMNYFSLIKHDLQVNNVASEICAEYGTQGIQNSEWKETIVAHCKSSNRKGLMIDLSLKARLNSTIELCESFLSDLEWILIKMTSQLRISHGSSMAQSQEVVFSIHRSTLIWFLCGFSVEFWISRRRDGFFLSVSMRRDFSHRNYIWCFHFPSLMKLHCFITALKSEIAD